MVDTELTRHRDARVRRAACLAFSHVPSEQIPYREFLAVARSPAEDEDRRAALMAASFATVPEVWLLLHQLAKDPLDPTWPVAVSRLGDVGNGFTVAWLEALPLELGQRTEIQSTLQMVRCREASRNPVELPLHAETCLRRAAWAETSKHPLAPRLAEWTLTQLREWQTTPAVANHLQSLAEDPQLRDLLRRAAR